MTLISFALTWLAMGMIASSAASRAAASPRRPSSERAALRASWSWPRCARSSPRHVAVEGFDLDVPKGEFVSFLGPSGCGKTTTLRMIAGFELPTVGTIRIDGQDISRMPPNARNVGMVFQSYALFPNMSVADNIAFGLEVRKRPRTRSQEGR